LGFCIAPVLSALMADPDDEPADDELAGDEPADDAQPATASAAASARAAKAGARLIMAPHYYRQS
jgi:hypothetical protein